MFVAFGYPACALEIKAPIDEQSCGERILFSQNSKQPMRGVPNLLVSSRA
jgi:hypothetical protein